MDCIFCKIASGAIPADIVHQDKQVMAFRDVEPQAPTHIIVIPKSHIASVTELSQKHKGLLSHLVLVAKELAEKEGVSKAGYRLTINCGPEGGQIVPHLHLHLLGGRKLRDEIG